MTTIHLIRHGKASPSEANYDQLHVRGVAQARMLGVHLAGRGARFDAMYSGPLVRQRDTLRLMRESAGATGAGWPEAVVLDGLAEAPVELIVRECMAERLGSDAVLDTLVARVQAAGEDRPALRLAMGAVWEYMLGLWHTGALARDDLETYAQFRGRVLGSLETMLARARGGEEVAAVTSNGVISCLVEHVHERAGETQTASPELLFANTSITRLTAGDGSLAIVARNVLDHIDDPAMVTYL